MQYKKNKSNEFEYLGLNLSMVNEVKQPIGVISFLSYETRNNILYDRCVIHNC